MASVKLKFRPPSDPETENSLYYQISHGRSVKYVSSDFKIKPDEWNSETSSIIGESDDGERQRFLSIVKENITTDINRFQKIIYNFCLKNIRCTVDDIVSEFNHIKERQWLFAYLGNRIHKLKENGKYRTAETYQTALNSFKRFRNNIDIQFDSVTADVIEAYESYLYHKGLCPNSVSFHLRILRAVYNRAVSDGITEQANPFGRVYTGVEKTNKRAIGIDLLKQIKEVELKDEPMLAYSRDMFLLSFFFRGMSFIDMAYLKKTDLKGTMLSYRRRKTGQILSIQWTREMQTILDRYPKNTTQYLLPIITVANRNPLYQYRRKLFQVNAGLKLIANRIGTNEKLTTYVARHSWASIAKLKGVSMGVISEGLGHSSETTTRIYLATLDATAVDKANSIIISSLL